MIHSLALALLAGPALQEGAQTPVEPSAPALAAATALRSMAAADLVLEGEARLEEPEEEEVDDTWRGVRIQLGGMSPFGNAAPFTGPLELLLRKEGDLLLRSEQIAPGFVTYSDGALTLNRVTFEDTPPSLDPVVTELTQLLDLDRLATEVEAAEVEVTAAGKRTIYAATLRTAYVQRKKPAGGLDFDPFGEMRPQILKLRFELVVDAEGRGQRLDFGVTRSDPEAAFLQQVEFVDANDDGDVEEAEEVAVAFGGVGGQADPVEGATSTYTFHRIDLEPTEKATKALADLRAAARELRTKGR